MSFFQPDPQEVFPDPLPARPGIVRAALALALGALPTAVLVTVALLDWARVFRLRKPLITFFSQAGLGWEMTVFCGGTAALLVWSAVVALLCLLALTGLLAAGGRPARVRLFAKRHAAVAAGIQVGNFLPLVTAANAFFAVGVGVFTLAWLYTTLAILAALRRLLQIGSPGKLAAAVVLAISPVIAGGFALAGPLAGAGLRPLHTLAVGYEDLSIAFSADGRTLLVLLSPHISVDQPCVAPLGHVVKEDGQAAQQNVVAQALAGPGADFGDQAQGHYSSLSG